MSHYTDFCLGMSPGQVDRVHNLALDADRFSADDRPRLDDLIFQAAEDDAEFCPKAEEEIKYFESVELPDNDDE